MTIPELTVTGLTWRGEGSAEGSDGAALTLPGALPGERVRPPTDARPLEIVAPAPHRAAPPCRHAPACGGCALQHADLGWLADWKRARVIEAVAQAGSAAPVGETRRSAPKSRRRVSFSARRLKKGAALGFHAPRSDRIVPLEACLLAAPEIVAAIPALRELAALAATRSGVLKVAVTATDDGLDVALSGAREARPGAEAAALWSDGAAWAQEADAAGTRLARLTWNGAPLLELRPPHVRFGRARTPTPPGAFLQATEEGEAALCAVALEALAGAERVADLYAGLGAFALRLAERAEVLAVEGAAEMTAALAAGWRGAPGLKRVAAVTRDLAKRPLLPHEFKGLDGAVLDPPRRGAEAQAKALAALAADDAAATRRFRTLVAISCNPASFARDAALLIAGGWRLESAVPIDQFLWSAHVELAAVFRR